MIDVWERRGGNCAVRYRCFEVLGENKFGVQNADFFYPETEYKQGSDLDSQFLELFLDIPPDERTEVFSSLEEAIKKHQEEFD
jgi:hypothetical protein